MRVFLTGATGFVGNSVLKHLLSNRTSLVATVRQRAEHQSDEVEWVVGDLNSLVDGLDRDHNNISIVMKDIDVVVHTAARAHVMQEQAVDPLEEYRKLNCDATLSLARIAAESDVKRFVFVSSIKVNGEMTRPDYPFLPSDEYVPTDPYGLSKYEAEQGLLKIARQTGMEVVIIRPPLIYGAGVKANFASMMNWMSKRIPLPFGAIHNKRSLVALDNLVDFIVLCADREKSSKAANQVFLISDGEDVSTTQLLQKVAKAQNKQAWLIPVPVGLMTFIAKVLGKGDVANRLFGSLQVDSSKGRDLLGWHPVVTMDEQLKKMADAPVPGSAKNDEGMKTRSS
jgi:nucleoside-diphosphate-sugar epimerase